MRYRQIIIAIIVLASCAAALGQWQGNFTLEEENQLDGGVGMTWIDGEAYYTIGIAPDLSFGKLGFGLNIQLLYNTETGKIRTMDWNSPSDYARLIRYIRYGHKGDPFYTQIGALDRARIGHGYLMNFYRNQINYDERKIGLITDTDLGAFGFESLTSNLGRFEILATRVYARPIWNSRIPILKHFAIGATYITDQDPDAHTATSNEVSTWGIDIELPLIRSMGFNSMIYADHASFVEYGSGQALGISAEFDGILGLAKFGIAFERRWMGAQFVPNFFGPFYEVHRFAPQDELINHFESLGGDTTGLGLTPGSIMTTKHAMLPMMQQRRKGWYGGLYVDLLHIVKAVGTYQKIDDMPNSGELHLDILLSRSIPFIAAEAGYDKIGMDKLKEIFKLDESSVAWLGLGYKINPYMLIFVDYIWNFKWDEKSGRYKSQERFQPRIAFRYNF
ncbi:hypothetical protein KAR48_20835 [bacterium]|nr:hypothetical protein [bacterium]